MIHSLVAGEKEVLLLGTAHVSRQSTQLVTEVIHVERPDTVCVELCPSRYQSIRYKDKWREMNIVRVIKEKKTFLLLSHLLLASFQKKIAEKLDVSPGEEMIKAVEAAEAVGAGIHLADRDVRITLSRAWRTMSLWGRIKLLFQILLSIGDAVDIDAQDVEKMKQEDVLESVLADIGKSFPVIRDILIDERDRYLAHKIRTAPGKKIVAVVGAGHVPGIKAYWEEPVDVPSLEQIPPASGFFRLMKWVAPLAIVALIGGGFFYGGKDAGARMVIWWVAANGILAGIGALAAMAHPLTILSAVLAAPLTSLNPMIAAGWVSGLVEAFSRKPKVKDFENLQQDIHTFRGFWKNNITRILLVVAFTNIGSSIGTFVAIPLMVKAL